MASLWPIAKALRIPLDSRLGTITDLPYTISYVMRKRLQIDSLSELPREKRPPDNILWSDVPEDLEEWLDTVLETKSEDKEQDSDMIHISEREIG